MRWADLRIGGEPRIIGVLPPVSFRSDVQFYRPALHAPQSDDSRHSNNWQQFGRLDGATRRRRKASWMGSAKPTSIDFRSGAKSSPTQVRSDVVDFQTHLIGETRSTLTMLVVRCLCPDKLRECGQSRLIRATGRQREGDPAHAGASFSRLADIVDDPWCCRRSAEPQVSPAWWGLQAAPFLDSISCRRRTITRRCARCPWHWWPWSRSP